MPSALAAAIARSRSAADKRNDTGGPIELPVVRGAPAPGRAPPRLSRRCMSGSVIPTTTRALAQWAGRGQAFGAANVLGREPPSHAIGAAVSSAPTARDADIAEYRRGIAKEDSALRGRLCRLATDHQRRRTPCAAGAVLAGDVAGGGFDLRRVHENQSTRTIDCCLHESYVAMSIVTRHVRCGLEWHVVVIHGRRRRRLGRLRCDAYGCLLTQEHNPIGHDLGGVSLLAVLLERPRL